MRILSERGFPPALGTKPQSIYSTIIRANGTKLKFSEASARHRYQKKYEPTKFQAGILVWIFSVTATNFTQACHFLTETEL